MNPQETLKNLNEATAFIRKHSCTQPVVGLTLGSGLAGLASAIKIEATIDFKNVPHFSPAAVEGHPGKLLLGELSGVPIVALQGRIHFYEGHSMEDVVFPTRVLGRLGVKLLVLTNAAGGILPAMKPGDLMIILDHINLTGQNPLRGPNVDELGTRFPDMTDAYSPRMNRELEALCTQQKVRFHKGIYCGVSGPSYETPAEVRYFQKIGVGAVGMSTVAETIAARHMGMEVVGLSCVTNVAAGLREAKPLLHDDVKLVAHQMEKTMSTVVKSFVERIGSLLKAK